MTISGPITRPTSIAGAIPLEPGDRLSRDEFERRYEATPWLAKAELIEGVVHVPPPVKADDHGCPHADLVWWLVSYRVVTPWVRVADNSTIRLGPSDEPQPDATAYIDPRAGGRVHITADNYIEGAPELVAEVSGSTVSIDLHSKLRMYRAAGVHEYIVHRVTDAAIDWFVLRGGEYCLIVPGPDGVLRSEAFPGLWLDAAALVGGEMETTLRTLQAGLATPEHAAFVAQLHKRSAERRI